MCHLFKCFCISIAQFTCFQLYIGIKIGLIIMIHISVLESWSNTFLVLVQVPVDQNHLTEEVKLFVLSITIFLNLRDLKFVIQTSKNCLTQFRVSSRTPCPISSVNNEWNKSRSLKSSCTKNHATFWKKILRRV